jgi:hypothetical protein
MRRLFTLVVILFSIVASFSQKGQISPPPNLSGTWELDLEKTYTDPMAKVTGRTLVIEHSDPVVRLTWTTTIFGKQESYSETLYSDKRMEENAESVGASSLNPEKSKTYWRKRTLIREILPGPSSASRIYSGGPVLERIEYSLSKDGRKLIVTAVFRSEYSPYHSAQGAVRSPQRPTYRPIIGDRQVFNRK